MWKLPMTVLVTMLAVCACNSNSAGRHYTFAKVDRYDNLIPARMLTEQENWSEPESGLDSLVDGYFGLTLDSGYIRYLQSVAKPEVVIFTRVTVRRPEEAGEKAGFVFQSVHLTSESQQSNIELNKDSSFPRADVEVLPPFEYAGEIITVEIRVIEMDSDDNERTKQLVNLAATTAAAGVPESAAAISVFQTVLTFLVENNRDDIEFAFDFQLASADPNLVVKRTWLEDLVVQPRIGTYVVVKTEHLDRVRMPDSILGLFAESLTWTLARLLQLGTVNLLNWFGDPAGNRYSRLLGRPFEVDTESTQLPLTSNGWIMPNNEYAGAMSFVGSDHKLFIVENKHLKTKVVADEDKRKDVNGPDKRRAPQAVESEVFKHFRDQSYIVFSISERKSGISYEQLEAIAAVNQSVDNLKIRTAQATPEEWKAGLEQVQQSALRYIVEEKAQKAKGKIARAGDNEKLEQAAIAEFEDYVAQLEKLGILDGDSENVGKVNLAEIKVKAGVLPVSLNRSAGVLPLTAGYLKLYVPEGRTVDGAAIRLAGQPVSSAIDLSVLPDLTLDVPSSHAPLRGANKALVPGHYELLVDSGGELSVLLILLDRAPTVSTKPLPDNASGKLTIKGENWMFATGIRIALSTTSGGVTTTENVIEEFDSMRTPDSAGGRTYSFVYQDASLAGYSIDSVQVIFPDGLGPAVWPQ